LNKLCHQFNTNILAGCKTQVDWHQASNEQQFRNVIGVGVETRSIVSYNVNEQMQRNQYGGCATMAMGCFSAETIKTGVDPYRLGQWCWLRVSSGDKKSQNSHGLPTLRLKINLFQQDDRTGTTPMVL
jgi:hypothetical protein